MLKFTVIFQKKNARLITINAWNIITSKAKCYIYLKLLRCIDVNEESDLYSKLSSIQKIEKKSKKLKTSFSP